ncbi:hypothetical protein DB032_05485 [Chromobacterium sp. Panama]|uniref:radical SAM protein n=1 Tax=Chromobacterium sp. Panama TaxID=2161826 RepID=UPI000D31A416|nr:radical SAM protein [Chromobacterium sp. Panama]PTU64397.1 hypothetical protein DB032_05485 [Chromobacterium sp. Panama]
MIIRLTASCNNKCFFCIVDDEIAQRAFRPLEEIVAELDQAAPDEEVDIFGGEPTIDPVFWEVLREALKTGRRVSLASNVRLFSHRPSAERLAAMADGRLEVRTSLMGHSAELHDKLNGVREGAFRQTLQGIRRLSELGFDIQTNIVILAENVEHLLATGVTAVEAGSSRLKFSGTVRTGKFIDSIADPALVRERLRTIVPLFRALGVPVTLEKLAPCLIPDFLDLLIRDSDPAVDTHPWYEKTRACRACRLADACPGAERGALIRHGRDWVRPLAEIPAELIDEVRVAALERYQPRRDKPFLRVLFDHQDLSSLGVIASFSRQHPQLYLIA